MFRAVSSERQQLASRTPFLEYIDPIFFDGIRRHRKIETSGGLPSRGHGAKRSFDKCLSLPGFYIDFPGNNYCHN